MEAACLDKQKLQAHIKSGLLKTLCCDWLDTAVRSVSSLSQDASRIYDSIIEYDAVTILWEKNIMQPYVCVVWVPEVDVQLGIQTGSPAFRKPGGSENIKEKRNSFCATKLCLKFTWTLEKLYNTHQPVLGSYMKYKLQVSIWKEGAAINIWRNNTWASGGAGRLSQCCCSVVTGSSWRHFTS